VQVLFASYGSLVLFKTMKTIDLKAFFPPELRQRTVINVNIEVRGQGPKFDTLGKKIFWRPCDGKTKKWLCHRMDAEFTQSGFF
jgi:hypothetical protein